MGESKKAARVSRFVKPEVVRLNLSEGDWLEVKKELTVGEARAVMASMVKTMRADGRIEPDLSKVGKAEIAAYIVDWSFVDESDKRVPYSSNALDNLTVSTFDEIEASVKAHIASVEAARGKSQTGSSSS